MILALLPMVIGPGPSLCLKLGVFIFAVLMVIVTLDELGGPRRGA